jgi:hypothetical protein
MAKIKLRRDTAANWSSANPVLALGEPGYDTTNNKIKMGDGTSTWTQLSYLTSEGGGGDTGQWAFNGDTAYNSTGNGLYIQPGQGNADGSIYIPTTEEGGDLTIQNNSGGDGAVTVSTNNKTWVFDANGDLSLPAGGDIKDSNGNSVLGGGTFNGTATNVQLTGTIPYTNNNVLSTVVDFERPNNEINTVDVIDTGLTLKRGNNGGIYNSADNVETNWNSNQSPLGTEWNADGWGDLTDVQTRTYTTFYEACDQNIGSVVTHKQFVMHDTINDKYYKIKFHFWQPNNGGGANQSLDGRSGFSYTRTLLDLSNGVYFVRGADDTNLGDEIGPGLTIKRDQAGGIYNSEVDAEWDPDNTPTGTLWNDDGWDDFTDITTRTWKPLYSAVHGQLGNHLVGAELLMHDTINDRYYTVKFTDWGQNNGGSFAYLRREIDPTGTRLGITFADGSVQKTATTLGDLRVVNGNVFENAVKSGDGAEIRYDVKNNFYYGTWAWTGTANWVTSGNDGYIQFDNGDTNNSNQVDFRRFLNDLGRWQSKTVSINGGDPQTITNWSNNYIYTEDAPATDPTEVTEIRFYVTFRSRFYMGGENTVGFFLNDRDESFEVQSRDINLYGDDDVRIRGKDLVEIRNNGTEDGVRIVADGDNTNKTWEFMPDGSIQLPNLSSTGWNYNYGLQGSTLKLGTNQGQTIITGSTSTQIYPNAQRIIIQGQRGYGTWGQNTAGEGGDVYIWGGVGGESDGGGGSGGDIKVRGGQGQNSDGGYVKIEGGSAAGWNNSPTGGYVEIRGGDAVEGGNGDGGDVRIFGGKKHGTGNNGEVYIRTGANEEFEWKFDNAGQLTVAGSLLLAFGVALNSTAETTQIGHPPISIALIDTINLQNVLYVDVPDIAPFNTIVPGDIITMNGGGDPQTVAYTGLSDGNFRIGLPTGYYQSMDFPLTVSSPTYTPFAPATVDIAVSGNTWSFSGTGLATFPGDLLIGTLWPNDPQPMGDKESVVWAKDDTEYLGLWWGGSQTYPEGGYGPVAGIMIGAYDDMTDDFTNDPSPADTKVTIGVNDANGSTLTWHFDRDGTTTLPGAVVNSTVTKTATPNTGIPLTLGDSTYGVSLSDGSYGPFTGSIVGIVYTVVVSGGTAAYTIVSYPGNIEVNTVIDQLDAGSLGGTPGNTSNITVTSVNDSMALDLNKSINKLADGFYTLADGVEGQIMYLVPQSGITPANVSVDVGNYRVGGFNGTNGGLYPFRILNDANASYFDSRGFCTLIFTDGAWQQSGGSWD